MTPAWKEPFYKKLAFILLSLALMCMALVYGRTIVLPLMFAILLANILLPVTHYLIRKKIQSTMAILIPLLLGMLASLGVIYFLTSQVLHFSENVPAMKERITDVSHSLQLWVKETTGITLGTQDQYIKKTLDDLQNSTTRLLGSTFNTLSELTIYLLIPIYTFLLLFYRDKLKTFLIQAFKGDSDKSITRTLTASTKVVQQYIIGLLIETTLVFILNASGFLILGIKYALFLALLAALLNLIPYIGIVIANLICMFITMINSDSLSDVLWVGGILAVVQFLDNNVGMTLIVGNKVRINALVTILGVLIGGALCGVAGMFLAIPAVAVMKVMCDNVPGMEHWGALLGDIRPEKSSLILKRKGSSKKKKNIQTSIHIL